MKGTTCMFLLACLCCGPLTQPLYSQQIYNENFDEATYWAGGTAGSYTPKTYQSPELPDNDVFDASEAVRESTNAVSGYAWRLRNSGTPEWTYSCGEEVGSFSVYLAHWSVSAPLNIEIETSQNSGITYNTIVELDENWWTGAGYGDKEFRQFNSGSLNIAPDPGENIVIRIRTDGLERLLIDDFMLTYNSVSSGIEDPLFFSATAISESQIDLVFAPNNSNDDLVIAFDENGSFDNPSGPPPSVGQSFAGGTLFYSGLDSPQSHEGLDPGQTVYYRAWSYNGSDYSTGLSAESTTLMQPGNLRAWINEFHYDNDGGDLDEFVEVVVENAGITSLETISVSLYNGSTGEIYASASLSTFEEGSTVNDFTYFFLLIPGIQNGAPEGIALDVNGVLVPGQFISYEGSFYATEGPADGLLSADIGLEEPATTPVGFSLQLAGTGMDYTHFLWEGPLEDTPGEPNQNQETGNYTTWKGTVSSNWNEAGNWENGLPSPELHALVAAVGPEGYSPSIEGPVTIENLILDAGAALEIAESGALTVSGVFLNNGIFEILSGTDGCGSFISTSPVYGKAHRYLSPGRWHYVASPVENIFSDVFEGIYLTTWNEPEETWDYIEALGVPLNGQMKGYSVWTDAAATVLFEGDLNAGEKSIETTNTAGSSNPENDPSGYNLVGNPYPSALDWDVDDGEGWTRTATHIDMAIYYWTGSQYASYVKGGPNPGPNGGSNLIPPHQGFYVKCSEASGSIAVTNEARIHANQPFYKGGEKNLQYLTLQAVGNGFEDETVIYLHDQASVGFDKLYDAYKLSGSIEAPQLYSLATDGVRLAINAFPFSQPKIVVPLGFKSSPEAGIHELKIAAISGFEDIPVYLADQKEQLHLNLKASGGYKFFAEPGDDPDRFSLFLFADDIPLPVNTGNKQVPLLIAGPGTVSVIAPQALTASILVTNPWGQQIAKAQMINECNKEVPIGTYQGLCFITLYSQQGVVSEKILCFD